jgi:GxxExxY protein
MQMIDIVKYKDVCFDVVGAIYNVKKELGPGLNEKIYQEGLAIELAVQGIEYEREKVVHPMYRGQQMESTFVLDFYCKDSVIVELKSVYELNKEHRAQLFNYMHLVKPKVGILVNFAPLFAEVERYYYDESCDRLVNSQGKYIRNRYDDIETFNVVR